MEINDLTGEIIGAAIEVHRHLGPGLLESSYEVCFCRELELRGIPFEKQVPLPIEYKGVKLDAAYRIDVLVAKNVVVEFKAVEDIWAIHEAQVLTCLRIGRWPVGLIINFNVRVLTNGIKRLVQGLKE